MCLFCVEKKGWSDDFASGSSYNEHYWRVHQGVIQRNEKIRNVEKDRRKSDLQVLNHPDLKVRPRPRPRLSLALVVVIIRIQLNKAYPTDIKTIVNLKKPKRPNLT